jgi:hypothetical protein
MLNVASGETAVVVTQYLSGFQSSNTASPLLMMPPMARETHRQAEQIKV